MPLNERTLGDVTILDVEGRMTINSCEPFVGSAIRRLLGEGRMQLLLNLKGVPYIDSTGLADIIGAYTTTIRHGGTLKMEHLSSAVYQLLAITMLLPIFEVFDSEPAALASFRTTPT